MHLVMHLNGFSTFNLRWFIVAFLVYMWIRIPPEICSFATAAVLNDFTVIDFIKNTQRAHNFQQILFMRNRNASVALDFLCANMELEQQIDVTNATIPLPAPTAHCSSDENFPYTLMLNLDVALVQMNELSTFFLKTLFDEDLLALVYIDRSLQNHNGLLRNLVLNLRHMTTSNTIFLLNLEESNDNAMDVLAQIFQFCWKNHMINVVALLANYQRTATFYSYTHFPNFTIETKEILQNDVMTPQTIFPERMNNLNGYKLPYIVGGSDPRTIQYLDKDGNIVTAGFAGHFLSTFAEKFNCQLYEPLPAKMNSFAPSQEVIAAVRNGTVQISAALTFPSIPISGFSYPYEQMNWCVMIPVEPDVPAYEFYIIAFELTSFLITLAAILVISVVLGRALMQHGYRTDMLDVLLKADALRGALGQPFIEVRKPALVIRFIYLQIAVLGILLTTSYNAYYATYVTSAPKEAPLQTFDDILYSNYKVYAYTPEYNELLGRVAAFQKYKSMFYLETNFQNYLKMRDSFNTKFCYMTPSTKWRVINEQQKIFTTPIFRLREDLCFFNNIPMCFPVHENSIYMKSIQRLVLETAQSGLTNYWTNIGFLELIRAGKLSFADLSTKKEFEAMILDDMRYFWFFYGFMVALSSLVFLGELLIYYRKSICSKVKRIPKLSWGKISERT